MSNKWGAPPDTNNQPVTGLGIRVAVLDTGIDYTHPDLGGCFGPSCEVIGGYDFVNWGNDPMDDADIGRGTHVAGIVAADGDVQGVAPDAKLLAYKVLNFYGVGSGRVIVEAMEMAADPDGNPATDDSAHMVNMSLTAPFYDENDPLGQAANNLSV
ncbi:MAG: S8 family serine peptidase [Anaerolineales bacterium]